MKQIVFLFFTFSGICKGFGQKPEGIIDSISTVVKQSMRVFPNPAKNKTELEIKGFEPGYIQVQLIDNKGNLLRNGKRLVINGNEIIVLMFSEKPGLYFLIVRQNEKMLRSKLVIQ